jgi:aminoglycoside phosphotransferase family enzyme
MDLGYHGGADYSKLFWNAYKELAGEVDVDSLLTFYKVYRAFVRGKVNSFQVDDDGISFDKKEKAVQTARKYFKLAYSYID